LALLLYQVFCWVLLVAWARYVPNIHAHGVLVLVF